MRVAMVVSFTVVFGLAIGSGVTHHKPQPLVLFAAVLGSWPIGLFLGRVFAVWRYRARVISADAHAADRSQGYYVPPPVGPPPPKALSRTRRVVYTLIDIEAYGYFAFVFGFMFWVKSLSPQEQNTPTFGSAPEWSVVTGFLLFAAVMVFNFVWILFSLKRRRDRKAAR
jgi:hypothetical protein